MELDHALYLAAGALAGGFVNGLAGFGTSLFALGFFLTIMPPVQAVAVVLGLAVAGGLPGLWEVRKQVSQKPGRVLNLLLPALPGLPLGVWILSWIDADHLRVMIGGFLILYSAYFTLRRTLPRVDTPPVILDRLIGFAGGVLGGAASLSGALPTMWFAMRPWPKRETRAVLQPFNVAVLSIAALILVLRGAYTAQTLLYLALALPITVLAAQAGVLIFKRLSDTQFRILLIALCCAAGLILLVRTLL